MGNPYIIRFDSQILNGLPVEVTALICGPEPDVGIFSPYVEELSILVWDNILASDAILTSLPEADYKRLCREAETF